jgi:hypothetical protein
MCLANKKLMSYTFLIHSVYCIYEFLKLTQSNTIEDLQLTTNIEHQQLLSIYIYTFKVPVFTMTWLTLCFHHNHPTTISKTTKYISHV